MAGQGCLTAPLPAFTAAATLQPRSCCTSKINGLASAPGRLVEICPACAVLTFATVRSTYPPPAAGPLNADIRRGFKSPNNRARVPAQPSKRGLGVRGLFGFLKFNSFGSSDDGYGFSTMAVSPFRFLQEVRSETAKVTWPTRRETMITTIMVFVMVTFASIFFFFADQIIRYLITLVLGIH
jgi:preprotein translocase SecE subunit